MPEDATCLLSDVSLPPNRFEPHTAEKQQYHEKGQENKKVRRISNKKSLLPTQKDTNGIPDF